MSDGPSRCIHSAHPTRGNYCKLKKRVVPEECADHCSTYRLPRGKFRPYKWTREPVWVLDPDNTKRFVRNGTEVILAVDRRQFFRTFQVGEFVRLLDSFMEIMDIESFSKSMSLPLPENNIGLVVRAVRGPWRDKDGEADWKEEDPDRG